MVAFPVLLLFFLSVNAWGSGLLGDKSHYFLPQIKIGIDDLAQSIEKETGVAVFVEVFRTEAEAVSSEIVTSKRWVLIRFVEDSQLFLFSYDKRLENEKIFYPWDAHYLRSVLLTEFGRGERNSGILKVLASLFDTLKCNKILNGRGYCNIRPELVLPAPSKRKPTSVPFSPYQVLPVTYLLFVAIFGWLLFKWGRKQWQPA